MSGLSAADFKELCLEAGASDYGLLYPENVDTSYLRKRYSDWLLSGNEGTVQYIDSRLDILCDPFGVRPQAKCALVIAFPAKEDGNSPLLEIPSAKPDSIAASIAGYAMEEDYHITGQRILEKISNSLGVWSEPCVDAKPVPEKEFALLAKIGERGLNTLTRLPGLGCQMYLGILFLGERFPQNPAKINNVPDKCCGCGVCIRHCPNGALDGKGSINVRKCRSWISGQKRGALTKEEQIALQGALFGCSVCSNCCPDATVHISDYKVDAMAVFQMPTSQLRRIIKGTALEHSGVTLLKRNAAAAICCQSTALATKLLDMTASPAVQDSIKAWL